MNTGTRALGLAHAGGGGLLGAWQSRGPHSLSPGPVGDKIRRLRGAGVAQPQATGEPRSWPCPLWGHLRPLVTGAWTLLLAPAACTALPRDWAALLIPPAPREQAPVRLLRTAGAPLSVLTPPVSALSAGVSLSDLSRWVPRGCRFHTQQRCPRGESGPRPGPPAPALDPSTHSSL